MGSLSNNEQRKIAYFHALGKTMTENMQADYESIYKSSHNVRLSEIWSDTIGYAPTYAIATGETLVNSAVTAHYNVVLTEISGSNGQSYAFISGGTFIRPWVSPVDVPHPTTNEPSYGYALRLFRGADAVVGVPNSEIFPTEGAWTVDYYAGIVHFSKDSVSYTPASLGWGSIKATLFQYTGHFGASGSTAGAFTTVYFDETTNKVTFNSGITNEQVIDLSSLSGGTSPSGSFTTCTFDDANFELLFNYGLSGETIVPLLSLTGLTSVTFNSGTSELEFINSSGATIYVNLSSLKGGGSSGGGFLATTNNNMAALTVTTDYSLACDTGLTSNPVSGSTIAVFVNGVQVNVGNGVKDTDCYFSNDLGVTAKTFVTISIHDKLYWNPTRAGYGLDASVDKITFMYLTF